jgi:hypothetical protein
MCGEVAASFETTCWVAAGVDSRSISPQSLSLVIKVWRHGLAEGEVEERKVLQRAMTRGNAAAAGRLYADRNRAPHELRQQIAAAPAGSHTELAAEILLLSVDDSAEEQRRLLAEFNR